MYVTNSTNEIFDFLNAIRKTKFRDYSGGMDQFYLKYYQNNPNATLAISSRLGYMIDVPSKNTKKFVSVKHSLNTPLDNVITKTYSPDGSIKTEYPGGWEITRCPKKGAYIVHNGIGCGYLSQPKARSKAELDIIIGNLERNVKICKEGNAPQKIIAFFESVLKHLKKINIK